MINVPHPIDPLVLTANLQIQLDFRVAVCLRQRHHHHPHHHHPAVGMCANVPRPLSTNKLVGDNLDKNVVARDMRIDYQGRSLHFFQMYAVKDRVDLTDVSDGEMKHPNLSTISFKTILPTSTDAEFMTTNFS